MQYPEKEHTVAIYLARPCQYVDLDTQPYCTPQYWTNRRFAPEVIDAANAAIDILKNRYRAHKLTLAGYSGGGAVAALVAARRDDVTELITFAGNLDTQAWTTLHDISPLSGSLSPADYWNDLKNIPQTHYVGAQDDIMPPVIAQSYARRFSENMRPEIIIEEG